MDTSNIALVVVALISAWAGITTARSTSKANTKTAESTSRTAIETEAYNRARKFDTDTIERQDNELKELRLENEKLRAKVLQLEERIDTLEHPPTV